MQPFEITMIEMIETNMSESMGFDFKHVNDWNEYVRIHWVYIEFEWFCKVNSDFEIKYPL